MMNRRMKVPFQILEHTADVGFEAFGQTREEVFVNAARALMHLLVDVAGVRVVRALDIQVEASTGPELLVNWLSELLYLHETERMLFRDFEIRHLDDRSLRATAAGETFDPLRHRIQLQVKAITYHQLRLASTAEGWRAQVYVDI